jgi:hypothetical protein
MIATPAKMAPTGRRETRRLAADAELTAAMGLPLEFVVLEIYFTPISRGTQCSQNPALAPLMTPAFQRRVR